MMALPTALWKIANYFYNIPPVRVERFCLACICFGRYVIIISKGIIIH